nr:MULTISPECIES: hypothetical protein [unclassified Pseudoalteromonas]
MIKVVRGGICIALLTPKQGIINVLK